MKTITKFFMLAAVAVVGSGVAQAQATIDFETVGNAWTWNNWNDETTTLPVVDFPQANPNVSGINTSANCGSFEATALAPAWVGTHVEFAVEGVDPVTFSVDNCIVKVMVYCTEATTFGVKMEIDANNAKQVNATYTKPGVWQELLFDFTSQIGKGSFLKLVLYPLIPGQDQKVYYDNISFNPQGTTTALPEVVSENSVKVSGSSVKVSGGSSIEIINVSGVTVEAAKSEGSFVSKSLTAGVYIVKVDGKATKVLVK